MTHTSILLFESVQDGTLIVTESVSTLAQVLLSKSSIKQWMLYALSFPFQR